VSQVIARKVVGWSANPTSHSLICSDEDPWRATVELLGDPAKVSSNASPENTLAVKVVDPVP
jgi:hypothetical protein